MTKKNLLFSLVLFLILPNFIYAKTITVSNQPLEGVDYTDLTTAIIAAESGDEILMKSGHYDLPDNFVINKKIILRGDNPMTYQSRQIDALNLVINADGFQIIKVNFLRKFKISGQNIIISDNYCPEDVEFDNVSGSQIYGNQFGSGTESETDFNSGVNNEIKDNYFNGSLGLINSNNNIIKSNKIFGLSIFTSSGNIFLKNSSLIRIWSVNGSKNNHFIANSIADTYPSMAPQIINYGSGDFWYLNDFEKGVTDNLDDEGSDAVKYKSINYIYNTKNYSNFLGNYWGDCIGSDGNGDGVMETVCNTDLFPLVNTSSSFTYLIDNSKIFACTNGIKDSTESDIDCGGFCYSCSNGKKCAEGADCYSGKCTAGICEMVNQKPNPPTDLSQSISDGSSLDVGQYVSDSTLFFTGRISGGSGLLKLQVELKQSEDYNERYHPLHQSAALPSGSLARVTVNENSLWVFGDYHWRARTVSVDGAQQSDWVDFGSNNQGKADFIVLRSCLYNSNCQSGKCKAGVCVTNDLCSNNQKDSGEADIDCGGVCTARCANGKKCGINSDCQSGTCDIGICSAESGPLSCNLEFYRHGSNEKATEIIAGGIFDIKVTGSGSIETVKFANDDTPNDAALDPGTNWSKEFNWTGSGDDGQWHWDSDQKVMTWNFGTVGAKQIWAEVAGNSATKACSGTITSVKNFGAMVDYLRMKERDINVTVDGKNYIIATLRHSIDSGSGNVIENSSESTIYLNENGNQINDIGIIQKINVIDYANKELQKLGPDGIKDKMDTLNKVNEQFNIFANNSADNLGMMAVGAMLNEGLTVYDLTKEWKTIQNTTEALTSLQKINDLAKVTVYDEAGRIMEGNIYLMKKTICDPVAEMKEAIGSNLIQSRDSFQACEDILDSQGNNFIGDYQTASTFIEDYQFGELTEGNADSMLGKVLNNYSDAVQKATDVLLPILDQNKTKILAYVTESGQTAYKIGTAVPALSLFQYVFYAYDVNKATSWEVIMLTDSISADADKICTRQNMYYLDNNIAVTNSLYLDPDKSAKLNSLLKNYIDCGQRIAIDPLNGYIATMQDYDQLLKNDVINLSSAMVRAADLLKQTLANLASELANALTSVGSWAGNQVTYLWSMIHSPCEIYMTDNNGRTTGVKQGKIFNEIPGSLYLAEKETVLILNPEDINSYHIDVVGKEDKNEKKYGLDILLNQNGQENFFHANEIPINSGNVHDYSVDWAKLFAGQQGVVVNMDQNGDGVFEKTYYSGSMFTMPNEAPTSSAGGPYTGNEGDTITLDASGSKAEDGQIVKYAWDLDNDGIYETEAATSTIDHVWKDDFQGKIGLQITQNLGLNATSTENMVTATSTADVLIKNVAPVVEAGEDICGGKEVTFNGSFNDPGTLDTHTYHWNFGDGNNVDGDLKPTHKYLNKGTYTAKLTVTDNDGGIGSDTVAVIVNDAVASEIVIDSPQSKTYVNTKGSIPITFKINDLCGKSSTVKVYLNDKEYASSSMDLGQYLGGGDYTLKVEATDASGNKSDQSVKFSILPDAFKSFSVKDMAVKWQFPRGKTKGGNPIFTISGQFELPAGYQKASFDKSAFLSLLISGKLGKEKINFREMGDTWLYKNSGGLNQGINIKSAMVYWWPDKNFCGKDKKCAGDLKNKNWFYIRGELTNGADINALPRQAQINLELPLAPYGQKGSLSGGDLERFGRAGDFWNFNSPFRWNYWPGNWWNKWDNFDIRK